MTNHLCFPSSPVPSHRLPDAEAEKVRRPWLAAFVRTCTPKIVRVGNGTELAELEKIYVIEDRFGVLDFIREHNLNDVLLQAREPLDAAFGPQTRKVLRLVHDPDDGSASLFCLALTPSDVGSGLEARWAFERDWWTERCGAAIGLNFDFETV